MSLDKSLQGKMLAFLFAVGAFIWLAVLLHFLSGNTIPGFFLLIAFVMALWQMIYMALRCLQGEFTDMKSKKDSS